MNPETVAKKLLPRLMSKMMLAEPTVEKYLIPHLWAYSGEKNARFERSHFCTRTNNFTEGFVFFAKIRKYHTFTFTFFCARYIAQNLYESPEMQ